MMTKLILTVGNALMGDDGAGALLAQMIQQSPLDGWEALHGGSAPENLVHRMREIAPHKILVIDAADMDLEPGEVRRIQDEKLEDPFLLTTHTLPLTFLIEALREFTPSVELIGIQPKLVAFGCPITKPVEHAVQQVYAGLRDNQLDWPIL